MPHQRVETSVHIATQSMVSLGRSFINIVDPTHTIKDMDHESHKVSDNWPHHYGSYSYSHRGSQF